MGKMINWLQSSVTTPSAGRWLIVKNSKRVIFDCASESGCKLIRYSSDDTQKDVAEGLKEHGFDLWAYINEGDQHE